MAGKITESMLAADYRALVKSKPRGSTSAKTKANQAKAAARVQLLILDLVAAGHPLPETEHRPCKRRWRFDLAWPELKVAVELDGGKYTGGHRRGAELDKENEKLNWAVENGWRVLHYTYATVGTLEAIQQIGRVIGDT